eukprot:9178334-Ditylum_brightwellii.AAC.1
MPKKSRKKIWVKLTFQPPQQEMLRVFSCVDLSKTIVLDERIDPIQVDCTNCWERESRRQCSSIGGQRHSIWSRGALCCGCRVVRSSCAHLDLEVEPTLAWLQLHEQKLA